MTVYKNGNMIIRGTRHFSLEQCLTCGQAFRWKKKSNGFFGIALGREVYAEQTGRDVTLFGVDESAGVDFIRYFDLERDYGAIKQMYAHDAFLQQGIDFAHGIRVLRQPPFETLISFIISSNNNVARISHIIDTLCERYGARIGDECDFPSVDVLSSLSVKDVEACGAGYRAAYIVSAAKSVADGFNLDDLYGMPYKAARQKLMTLNGVGPKVADCVALYSLGFTEAFPADVWMRRVLSGVYGYQGKNDANLMEFVDNQFGKYAGIAQQYLFHYARNNRHMLPNGK
ncbi:MAG: DNA-3-methyladenine glycosylase family protein [Christensenellales bacterium]|jgi:N-glycosylase/DNA lyase